MEIGYLGTAGWDWLSSRTAMHHMPHHRFFVDLAPPAFLAAQDQTHCVHFKQTAIISNDQVGKVSEHQDQLRKVRCSQRTQEHFASDCRTSLGPCPCFPAAHNKKK